MYWIELFLKVANLIILIKQKSPSLPRNVAHMASWDFNSVLNKGKSTILSLFNGWGDVFSIR